MYEYDKAPTNPHHGGKMTPTDMVIYIEELETKLRESALQELSALGQASDAYQPQLLAEAKLAKAVRLIELAVELGRWDLNLSLRDEMIEFAAEISSSRSNNG